MTFARFAVLLLALLALAAPGALPARSGGATAPHPGPHWAADLPHGAGAALRVALTPAGGHVIGSPDAKLKVVEYMSYTCPHCAHFEVEGMPALRLGYIVQGKVSLEVRHLLRDGVDATVAQLTNCVPPARFLAFHDDMLVHQDTWMAPALHASEAQQERWSQGDNMARMRAIAGDLHLYDYAERHGLGRAAADRCFADKALSGRLVAQTTAAVKAGIAGTPGFMIGDLPLADTFSWVALQPQIDARL